MKMNWHSAIIVVAMMVLGSITASKELNKAKQLEVDEMEKKVLWITCG